MPSDGRLLLDRMNLRSHPSRLVLRAAGKMWVEAVSQHASLMKPLVSLVISYHFLRHKEYLTLSFVKGLGLSNFMCISILITLQLGGKYNTYELKDKK